MTLGLSGLDADVRREVQRTRDEVCALHAELPRRELVVWTAGNVSQRVPGADLFVIKPSGVSYDELTPEAMVVCDLDGRLVDGDRVPSSDTAVDTAFVGSSNLSRAALLDGLEWNVRLSGVATPELIRKFEATFDTYWADQAFLPYDPDSDADRLDDALAGADNHEGRSTITLAGLEVRPLPIK